MEPIYIPRKLTKDYVILNTNYNFIYGSSVHHEKYFGNAAICQRLCNTYAIPVRWSYCRADGWFYDSNYLNASIEIEVAIDKIPKDKPIIPFPKIGEGASRLRYGSPKLYAFLMEKLNEIKYGNIIYE